MFLIFINAEADKPRGGIPPYSILFVSDPSAYF